MWVQLGSAGHQVAAGGVDLQRMGVDAWVGRNEPNWSAGIAAATPCLRMCVDS